MGDHPTSPPPQPAGPHHRVGPNLAAHHLEPAQAAAHPVHCRADLLPVAQDRALLQRGQGITQVSIRQCTIITFVIYSTIFLFLLI